MKISVMVEALAWVTEGLVDHLEELKQATIPLVVARR